MPDYIMTLLGFIKKMGPCQFLLFPTEAKSFKVYIYIGISKYEVNMLQLRTVTTL